MKLKYALLLFYSLIVQLIFSQTTCIYGSYSGTGVAHSILGIGFTPAVVIICGGSNGTYFKSSTMGATSSRVWANNGALVTNAITGFESDGFSVGSISGVNASGTTYYFVAYSSSFSGLRVGSYSGNGSITRNISYSSGGGKGLFTFIIPATSGGGGVICVNGSTYHYGYNTNGGSGNGNGSGSLPASGIQVYSNFNVSGRTYHYISFVNVSGESNGSSYSGNGSDNRNFTSLGFSPSALYIYKGGDTDVEWKNKTITTDNTMFLTAAASASNRIQSFITNGFQLGNNADVNGSGSTYYYMGVGGANVSTLPIELFHFDVQCASDKRSVDIHWTTASEINNDYFTIEKSTNGIDFQEIGKVKGAGNSTSSIDYLFKDNNLTQGTICYYRLKQTDFDGKNKTFNVVAKSCYGDGQNIRISLQQNPIVKSAITYNVDYNRDGLVTMQLCNNMGKEIDKTTFYHRKGFNTYYREIPKLQPGIYMLSVSDGLKKQTIRVVKQ